MELTITPRQLSRRSEFYYQLSQLASVGVGIISAIQRISDHPPARSYRQPLRDLVSELNHGFTLIEAIRRLPGWLPEFDMALIEAGEKSGRLDSCFRVLAEYYNDRARMARQVLSDLAYPVFLFHFAVFLLPFAAFFTSGNLDAYLKSTLGILIPIYVAVALAIFAGQSRHGERWRAVWERLLQAVPVLGRARRELALSRLAGAMEALLSAGVSIIEAWDLGAAASGSPAIRAEVASWKSSLEGGVTPAEMVTGSGLFPELFASQYATGEYSGRLEEQLQRLQQYYGESSTRSLQMFSAWVPRLFYIIVVALIGYRILSFWSGYFKGIGTLIGGL